MIGQGSPSWLKTTIRKVWDVPLTLQRSLLALGCLYTTFLIFFEAIDRYFLHLSLLWVEELTVYFVFWFYLMGAALVTHERTHIKGGAIHMLLRNRPMLLDGFRLGVTVLSLGLCCLFTVWAFGTFDYSMGSGRITVHTHLTYAYSQLSLIPGFILMAVYFLAEAVDITRGIVSKERYRTAPEIPLPHHVGDSGKVNP